MGLGSNFIEKVVVPYAKSPLTNPMQRYVLFLILQKFLSLFLQVEFVGDAGGIFGGEVADEDEGLMGTTDKGFDDMFGHFGVMGVETVEGLVEDEQFGVFDKGAGQQA